MGKRLAALLAVCALLTGTASAADPDEILSACGASGAVLIEWESGRVIAARQEESELPIASTTKIMTALLTIEYGDLDTPFVVDPDAIRVEGSSMGLQEGDTVTLRALLWGMLLSSGNDAANAAAVRVAGSIDAFVDRMNERAAELSMTHTHFSSPSGLERGEHYSTAADMARLARYALRDETFAEIAGSQTGSVSYGNPPYSRRLTNHNRLLSLYDGTIGVKTGYTQAAGRCLVSAVRRDGLTLIAVTLNCPDDFNVHQTLYDAAFSALGYVDFTDRVALCRAAVTGSESQVLPVRAAASLGAYLTAEERGHVGLSFSMEPFYYAPVRAGEELGTVSLTLDGETIATVPVVSAEDRPTAIPDNRSIIERIRSFFHFPSEEIIEFFTFP